MREQQSLIPSADIQKLVDQINAGQTPDLSTYKTITPYIEAIFQALSQVKPQTARIEQYLTYVDSLRSKDHSPRLHLGLLSLRASIIYAYDGIEYPDQ